MKYQPFSLLILAIITSEVSCKKDKNDSTSASFPYVQSTIVSIPNSSYHDTTVYEYDAQNRGTGTHSSMGGSTTTAYTDATIIKKTYNSYTTLLTTQTYTVMSSGWIGDCAVTSTEAGMIFEKNSKTQNLDQLQTITHQKYLYDDQGHLIKTVTFYDTGNPDTIFNYFQNDNITLSVRKSLINTTIVLDSAKYEYYNVVSMIEKANMGFPFFGKPGKNLLKRRTTLGGVYEYVYTLDGQNKVIRQTEYFNGSINYDVDYKYVEK